MSVRFAALALVAFASSARGAVDPASAPAETRFVLESDRFRDLVSSQSRGGVRPEVGGHGQRFMNGRMYITIGLRRPACGDQLGASAGTVIASVSNGPNGMVIESLYMEPTVGLP